MTEPNPVHPGIHIRENVIPGNVTVTQAATWLKIGRPALSRLLNGKASLSERVAEAVESVFDAPAGRLLRMQFDWDEECRRKAAAEGKEPEPPKPKWVVNDIGELGVEVDGHMYFLYKGSSLEYEDGKHDDGVPMRYREVYKREFGEVCHPFDYWPRCQACYRTPTPHADGYHVGPDEHWEDLPVFANPEDEKE